jgi:non-homologous end joining protein Ku
MELMERSSKLFEENYIDYYKTMIKTGSPISMIENFTADVIKDNNNGSIKDLLQLKKLSRFLRKMIAKQGAVPENVRKMMDKLENVFDSIGTNEFDEDFQEI